MNNRIEMKICPVCKRTLESLFALKGHLRLTMDPEHKAFRQQQDETVRDIQVPVTPVTPSFVGDKFIDVLSTLIKDQEQIYGKETKVNELFNKIKKMIEKEREIEKQYKELLENEEKMLKEKYERIEAELRQKYKDDLDKAVAIAKNEWIQNHQKEIENARVERNNEEYLKGQNSIALYIYNPIDGKAVLVQPGSPLHTYLNKLISGAWVSHPDDFLKVYEQHIISFMKQKLERKST